ADDFAPLLLAEGRAGRIVAAPRQQCDIARLATLQRRDHVLEADDPLPAFIIRVVDDIETHAADDRRVVGPARRAEEHARVRIDRSNQLEAEAERAAAPRRLQPGDALVAGVRAKHDRPQQLGESLLAGHAEIGLGRLY